MSYIYLAGEIICEVVGTMLLPLSENFSKHILSFEQASIEHGGDGAFYVYLRKNKK